MRKSLIALVCMLAVFVMFLQFGEAVTNNTTAATVTATVAETIDVTLSFVTTGTGIIFGSLNPGTNNNSATNFLNISIETTTNVATNLSQNGTNFVSGANTFTIGNLRYSNDTTVANSTVMTTTFPAIPPFLDWRDIPKPSTRTNRSVNYFLTIPSGQTAGVYTSNIFVNVSKNATG